MYIGSEKGGVILKNKVFILLTVISLGLLFGVTNTNGLTTSISNIETKKEEKIITKTTLLGTYTNKENKNINLTLKEDGTYTLNINVCEGYLSLTGNYVIANTRLKLINNKTNSNYETLNNNAEFSFTINNENEIVLDESLVCTEQLTKFER